MTDLETMKAMLKRAEIEHEEYKFEVDYRPDQCAIPAGSQALIVHRGYPDFRSNIVFAPDGSLLTIEAYE